MALNDLDLNSIEKAIAETQKNPNSGDVFFDTNTGNLTTVGGAGSVKTSTMIQDRYAA